MEYQPIVELVSGRIVSAEALVRWIDETGQPVRPELFIAMAEDKRFVTAITRHVASTTVREMGDLLSNGFRVTLNITAQDLADPTFAPFLKRCLDNRDLAPDTLGLELTERSTANHAAAIASLQSLKANGPRDLHRRLRHRLLLARVSAPA